ACYTLELMELIHLRTNDIFRHPSHKLFRELLPFVELDYGDTVSRNVLILGIPSPFVIVIDDMVAAVGSWSGPSRYNFIQ
ncbi:hypothetical protein Tco_0570248, partial [Tanacetum coccineum]